MKKKIVFLLPSLDGRGAEKVVVNIMNHLNKDKFNVSLYLIKKEGPYLKNLSNDIEVVNLQASRVITSLPNLIRKINKEGPDIVFSTIGHLNIALLLITPFLKPKPKIILREANSRHKRKNEKFNLKISILRLLYKKLYPKINLLIVQCEEMREQFLDYIDINEDKIKYIYNPVDLEFIKTQMNKENPYNIERVNLVAAGSLTYQKGFDILLKAFSIVRKEIPNLELTILGEGPLQEELETLANNLNISDKVNFVGFQSNPYVYFHNSDTFVLSSRWEGFPNVLLEALACDAKVVSTNCKTGPKEIIENDKYGFLAEVEDYEDLADAIINSLKSENKSSNRAQRFEVGNIIKEYENIFSEYRLSN